MTALMANEANPKKAKKTDPPPRRHRALLHPALGAPWLVWVLLLSSVPGCRKEQRQAEPKRPGDISLVHPMAKDVHRKTIGHQTILTMVVPVSPRRALAYYEHGLAKSWHLVRRMEDAQGTQIRVRRGLQIMDIQAARIPNGTKIRIVEGVQEAPPSPSSSEPDRARKASPRDAGIATGSKGARRGEHPPKRQRTPGIGSFESSHTLPKSIRLPKGWELPRPGKREAYFNESQDMDKLARELRKTMKAQKWTVMPSPGSQTSDRPDILDLVFTKGRTVLYLHLKGTPDGTLLTWMTASL